MTITNFAKLGIDIGSTTVKVALLDDNNELIFSDYKRHYANIRETLQGLLADAMEKVGAIDVAGRGFASRIAAAAEINKIYVSVSYLIVLF